MKHERKEYVSKYDKGYTNNNVPRLFDGTRLNYFAKRKQK